MASASLNDEGNLLKALTYNALGYTLSCNYDLSGDSNAIERGQEQFSKALALGDYALFHSNLAALYQTQGKGELARQSYEKALTIDPRYMPAQVGLGWSLYYLKGFHLTHRGEQDAQFWYDQACQHAFSQRGIHAHLTPVC